MYMLMVFGLVGSGMNRYFFDQSHLNSQLETVQNDIEQLEQAITNMTPKVDELLTTDGELRYGLKQLLIKQQNIHAKQARLVRFASKAERDHWLQNEITELRGNLTVRNNQV